MFRQKLLCLSLVLSLGTTETSLALSSLCPLRSSLNLLFSRLNSPRSLSLSLRNRCSSTFIMLMALCWRLYGISLSFLYWGGQKYPQHSRCGLTSAEQRGRITSLDLMATLPLMQPRIPLAFLVARAHCWLTLNLVSTKSPSSFSTKLLPSWSAASIWGCLGLFHPRVLG